MQSRLTPLARRMLRTGQTLHFGWGPLGARQYWLEPSQRVVRQTSAERSIPVLEPLDHGLFGTHPQSWRARDEA